MAESPKKMDRAVKAMEKREGKYLTFILGDEEYGISILKIKEIIGMMPITSIPRTPEFVKGVINLRGKVIPVMDLRLRFKMPTIDYSDRTCIIVVEIEGASEQLPVGCVVDAVSEVLTIKSHDIEDTPDFGTNIDTSFLLGMAKADGAVKILLDIDLVLNANDISCMNQLRNNKKTTNNSEPENGEK